MINAIHEYLPTLLRVGAIGQIAVALLNSRLVWLLRWESAVAEMPLLVREVFQVHAWFISITLLIFASFTLRFAAVMDVDPACRWMAGGMGIFWGIRTWMQVFYYDASHWRGKARETKIHALLLFAYSGLAATYLVASHRSIIPGPP